MIRRAHLAQYAELKYTPARVRPVPACGPRPPPHTRLGPVRWEGGTPKRCGSAPLWRRWKQSRSLGRVTWNPAEEDQAGLEETHPHLLVACRRRSEAAVTQGAAPKPRPDSHLTALERQGVVQPPRVTWPLERPDAASCIELRTDPVYPELDVVPPASASGCFIRMAPWEQWTRRSEPQA